MEENHYTLINIVTGIIVLVLNTAVSFWVSPIVVEKLGAEANGFTQMATNFVNYASLLSLAFNSMAGRFITVEYHKGNIEKAKHIFSSTMICNIVIVGLYMPIAIAIIHHLDSIVVIENADVFDIKVLFSFVFANYFFGLLASVYGISMFVKNVLYITNIIAAVRSFIYAIIVYLVFSYLHLKIYYISELSFFLGVIVFAVQLHMHNILLPDFKVRITFFDIYAIKETVSAGIWNTVNQCGNMLMTGMDLIVTDLLVSPSAMGVLAVAKTAPNIITSLAITLNSNLAPSLTISWANRDSEKLLGTIKTGMKISSIMVSVPLMIFLAFSVEFYSLWMPTLDAKQLAVLSFLTCMALIPWAGPQALNNIFSATNRLKFNTITFCCAGFLNVIIVYFLLKYTQLGIYAVAGTSSIITIIRCFTIVAPYIAHLVDVKWYTFYKDALISIICCFINWILSRCVRHYIFPSTWLLLCVDIVISVILCVVADLLIILNKNEREILLKEIKKKL